jgi:hypothetical protein
MAHRWLPWSFSPSRFGHSIPLCSTSVQHHVHALAPAATSFFLQFIHIFLQHFQIILQLTSFFHQHSLSAHRAEFFFSSSASLILSALLAVLLEWYNPHSRDSAFFSVSGHSWYTQETNPQLFSSYRKINEKCSYHYVT